MKEFNIEKALLFCQSERESFPATKICAFAEIRTQKKRKYTKYVHHSYIFVLLDLHYCLPNLAEHATPDNTRMQINISHSSLFMPQRIHGAQVGGTPGGHEDGEGDDSEHQ